MLTKKIILTALSCTLTDLLEEPSEAADSAHFIKPGHRI